MKNIQGLKLTPNEFKDLLIELYDGKQFERKSAIKTICNYWKNNGGIIEDKDYSTVFKKVCSLLKDKGLKNKGYGVWTLMYTKKEICNIEITMDESMESYNADKIIGEGDNSIYLYYYESYKELSYLRNSVYYACKIGRTDRDPLQRIYSQMGTCFPEKPHIALIIKCNNSVEIEKTIHSILKIRKKQMKDSPGKEWFLTNPEEVEEIYRNIIG